MKKLISLVVLSLFGTLQAPAQSAELNTRAAIAARCTPSVNPLYTKDFKWGYELPEMLLKFTEMYESPKRLSKNAYFDSATQTIRLPYYSDRGGDVVVDESFVQTVARHIEKGLQLDVVDAVFFPDMGHSHLLIPEKLMQEKYDRFPVQAMSRFYEEVFRDGQIKFLYHTAEQLKMLDENNQVLPDPRIRHRHRTRNLVGENHTQAEMSLVQNPASAANTASEVKGYFWWGAGFNLSANKKGCFAYRAHDRVYYFDISLYDLEYDPADGGW